VNLYEYSKGEARNGIGNRQGSLESAGECLDSRTGVDEHNLLLIGFAHALVELTQILVIAGIEDS